MDRAYIGVDPGNFGGVAVVAADGRASAVRMPDTARDLAEWLTSHTPENDGERPPLAVVERQHAVYQDPALARAHPERQNNAVRASFALGVNYSRVLTTLELLGVPYDTVPPASWKPAMGLRGKGKDDSISLARSLFPQVDLRFKRDDGVAEALLIAEYARRKGL